MANPFNFSDEEGESAVSDLDSEPEPAEALPVEDNQVVSGWDSPAEPRQTRQTEITDDEDADISPEEEESLQSNFRDRLDVAKGYEALLNQELFPGDKSQAALRIQREIRGFVRTRLKTLLGLPAGGAVSVPGGPGQFTPQEVEVLRELVQDAAVLKAVAAGLKKKAGGPVVAPLSIKPQQRPVPSLNLNPQRQAPQTPRPAPPPVAPPRPVAAKPAARAPVPGAPRSRAEAEAERILPQYRKDATLVTKGGQWYVQARNQDGMPQWGYDPKTKKREALLKNVTVPVKPTGPQPLPMPSIAQSNMMAEASAPGMMSGVATKIGIGNAEAAVLGSVIRANSDAADEENNRY